MLKARIIQKAMLKIAELDNSGKQKLLCLSLNKGLSNNRLNLTSRSSIQNRERFTS